MADVRDDDRMISQIQDSRMDDIVFGDYGSWGAGNLSVLGFERENPGGGHTDRISEPGRTRSEAQELRGGIRLPRFCHYQVGISDEARAASNLNAG